MDAVAIEVDSLHKTYRDGWFGRRRVEALNDVSFSVDRESIFGLLGPNGAGKTTLIKILLGLVYRTHGSATLLGRPAGDRSGRKNVGYLPENHRIPQHLTGNAALAYYGGLSGLSAREVRKRRAELLSRVGLSDWGKVSVKKYSKGMLQRLGLAQAILHQPQLLILDEPTDGVDPVGRSEMRKLLQELKSNGTTIFINSHLLQEVELICDRVAILVDGSLQRVGHIDEITASQQDDVQLTLNGSEPAIRRALAPLQMESCIIEPSGNVRVTVSAADQAGVNRCVDLLRDADIDIITLTRPRDSLEDAFLDIVTGRADSTKTQATYGSAH